jgi:hypothetical protein
MTTALAAGCGSYFIKASIFLGSRCPFFSFFNKTLERSYSEVVVISPKSKLLKLLYHFVSPPFIG